ncbi:MAG: nitroreductase [Gammaproteobacteria bacterium]|nr:nitroreductase [Gammaproteobacteria bacterium]
MPNEISSSKLIELISGRRTIHQFKEGLRPIEKLLEAIDLARWAPNHHLTEPWHFYLLGDETVNTVIELNTNITREEMGDDSANAKERRWRKMPGWFVVTCDKSDDPIRNREDYAACCCAVQNLMLMLWNEDVGVKWSTGKIIRDSRFYDLLWINPELETVVGLFWYGYAEDIPNMTRKPRVQIITELP